MSASEKVTQFHKVMGCPIEEEITSDIVDARIKLLKEEYRETVSALQSHNLYKIAQELADLAYVTYGTAVALGINLDKAIDIVHNSNMSKVGSVRDSDGKVLKGPHYRPPDMEPALPTLTYSRLKDLIHNATEKLRQNQNALGPLTAPVTSVLRNVYGHEPHSDDIWQCMLCEATYPCVVASTAAELSRAILSIFGQTEGLQ